MSESRHWDFSLVIRHSVIRHFEKACLGHGNLAAECDDIGRAFSQAEFKRKAKRSQRLHGSGGRILIALSPRTRIGWFPASARHLSSLSEAALDADHLSKLSEDVRRPG